MIFDNSLSINFRFIIEKKKKKKGRRKVNIINIFLATSRTGFFEIIGLKKKKEKSVESKKETITCKVVLKKRKRKISESSSVHSTDNNTRSGNYPDICDKLNEKMKHRRDHPLLIVRFHLESQRYSHFILSSSFFHKLFLIMSN